MPRPRQPKITAWINKHHTVLFIFFLALLIRLVYLLFLAQTAPLKFLPYHNDWRATHLLQGKTINFPDAWSSFYIILAGFYKLFDILGASTQKISLFVLSQNLLAAASVAILYLLSKRLFGKEKLALGTSLIFALYYPFIYLNTLILSETIFVFSIITALYLLLTPKRPPRALALSGLLFGLALISRPILTPFIPFLLLWLLLTSKRRPLLRLKTLTLLLVPLVAVVLATSLVNSRIGKHHHFGISGNSGVNFAMAQCRYKQVKFRLEDGETFLFKPPQFWETSLPEIETSTHFYNHPYYFRLGLSCLLQNPTRLITNLSHVANVYHSILYPDYNKSPIHIYFIHFWKFPAVIFTLAFLAFPFSVKKFRSKARRRTALSSYSLFLALFLSLIAAIYLASPGEERYLVSYFWLLPLYGLPTIFSLFKKH